jgi:hypothetical protein
VGGNVLKKIYASALLLVVLVLLAGCGNKKIEMIEDSGVSLSEDGNQLDIHITLDDENMEPETSFQVRLYTSSAELVKAMGTDMFVIDEEYMSHKEGEDSKKIEINETLLLKESMTEEELKKIIENKEENALEVDVLNNERVFATEGIHTVK